MKFYPKAIILNGQYQSNISITLDNNIICKIDRFTEKAEGYVISPAFVNAHSHLEYRGLINKIPPLPYWEWIQTLVKLKSQQTPEELESSTLLAAQENKKAGIALIGEISDRPYSGKALNEANLKGIIFQEVITFLEHKNPTQKLLQIENNKKINQKHFKGEIYLSPHTPYTVDPNTLKKFGDSNQPFTIHVAESYEENLFFEKGEGPFIEWYKKFDFPLKSPKMRVVNHLEQMGLAKPGALWVHCCDLNLEEIKILAENKVNVVHCPRSNHRLSCPIAPIKQMIQAGITVSLGLDSPASSGDINMLEEIRWAQKLSQLRNDPLNPAEVWNMATQWGAKSLGFNDWDIHLGSSVPLIKIFAKDLSTFQSMIDTAYKIEWINGE